MNSISKVIREPVDVEDCARNMRFEDCKMCAHRPRRGATWKQCKPRVQMFLRDGGVIL